MKDAPPTDTAPRLYEILCLVCLVLLLLVLLDRGHGIWSLAPFLVGLGGLAGRWRLALPAFLLFLTSVLVGPALFGRRWSAIDEGDALGDFLLCAAVLGYVAGQYRLQGVARHMLPDDPRIRKNKPAPKRSRSLIEGELPLLMMSVFLFAGLAPHLWEAIPDDSGGLGLAPRFWRLIVLAWILGLGLALHGALTVSHRFATREEAVLFLQDVFWRETRREQRRLYRYLTWAKLRADRRKECS